MRGKTRGLLAALLGVALALVFGLVPGMAKAAHAGEVQWEYLDTNTRQNTYTGENIRIWAEDPGADSDGFNLRTEFGHIATIESLNRRVMSKVEFTRGFKDINTFTVEKIDSPTLTSPEGAKITISGDVATVSGPDDTSLNATSLTVGSNGGGLNIKAVKVYFQDAFHKITVTQATGGTVTSAEAEAAEGETVDLEATPDEGYEFEKWVVDGEGASIDDTASPKAKLTMGTADVTVFATFTKKPEPEPTPEPTPADVPPVSVTAHVQRKGTLAAVSGGAVAGTTGKRLRMESLRLTVDGASATGGIEYRSHVQSKGWEKSYKRDGERSGTEGKSKRLEAVKIRLWGDIAKKYDVYYRVHSQRYGWMAWAKNGERAGTQGKAFRAEAVQVVLVAKGGPAPAVDFQGATQTCAKAFVKK